MLRARNQSPTTSWVPVARSSPPPATDAGCRRRVVVEYCHRTLIANCSYFNDDDYPEAPSGPSPPSVGRVPRRRAPWCETGRQDHPRPSVGGGAPGSRSLQAVVRSQRVGAHEACVQRQWGLLRAGSRKVRRRAALVLKDAPGTGAPGYLPTHRSLLARRGSVRSLRCLLAEEWSHASVPPPHPSTEKLNIMPAWRCSAM